jgi:hypothetical protein
VSSIRVLRDRLDGRRAGHAATDDDGVVSIGIGERVAAGAFEFVVVLVVVDSVVALQRCLLRPRLRIRCGEDRARGGRCAAEEVLQEEHACLLLSLFVLSLVQPQRCHRPAAMQYHCYGSQN